MYDHRRAGALRYLVFGALAVALTWAVVAHSLVAALVRIDPSHALLIRSDDPAALEALADRTIAALRRAKTPNPKAARFGFKGSIDPPGVPASRGGSSADDLAAEVDERARRTDDLRAWTSTILAQEPGNARALSLLGQIKRVAGDEESAATLLRASARRSLREPEPHAWRIHEAIKEKDWRLAMRHADILMRMHDHSIGPLTPLVAHLAETREAWSAVRDAVMETPPWRKDFLAGMNNAVSDARTPLELLLALKGTTSPPTKDELGTYLGFLVSRRLFDLAYYTWLQFLPPEQLAMVGPLFNGSFEIQPSGFPFDWQLQTKGAAGVFVARRPDRPSSRALVVNLAPESAGRSLAGQILRLTPGRYRLTGEVTGEIAGRRGVRWRVACVEQKASREIGASEMFVGSINGWKTFDVAIEVPETGCAAQTLGLFLDTHLPADRPIAGSIWFDELAIRRD